MCEHSPIILYGISLIIKYLIIFLKIIIKNKKLIMILTYFKIIIFDLKNFFLIYLGLWVWVFGDWPNPQSPIPNPQFRLNFFMYSIKKKY